MGAIAHLHDPEGDRLITLAKNLGEENLSAGERWRLQNTLEKRRRLEAQATQPTGRSDALDAQANERRFAAIETHVQWATRMLREILPEVIGESLGEEGQRTDAEVQKLRDELRAETEQRLNAQCVGLESAVREVRSRDQATMLETVRDTLGDAEIRIDSGLAKALEAEKERSTIELALVRDELVTLISDKRYGQPTADDDSAKLAEKAIAELRKRTTALEEEGARNAARSDQLAGAADQFTAFADTSRESTKRLLVRCAMTAALLKKETTRADELASKVAALESTLEELVSVLRENKALR